MRYIRKETNYKETLIDDCHIGKFSSDYSTSFKMGAWALGLKVMSFLSARAQKSQLAHIDEIPR